MKVKIKNLLMEEADIRLIQVGPTASFPTLETGSDYPFTNIGQTDAVIEAGIRLAPAPTIDCTNSLSHINNLLLNGTFKIIINGVESTDYLSVEDIGEYVSDNFNLELTVIDINDAGTYVVDLEIREDRGTYRIQLIPSEGSTINNANSIGSFSYLDSNNNLFFCIKQSPEINDIQSNGCSSFIGDFLVDKDGPIIAQLDNEEPIQFESFASLKNYLEELGFIVTVEEITN